MRRARSVVTVAVSFALWACGAAPPASLGEAIINGAIDPGDPAVMLVVIAQPAGATTGSLCSSVAITPHVLLTAAHCLSPDVVGPNAGYRVFVAADFRDAAQQTDPKNYLTVESVHPHPMFDGKANAAGARSLYDIGVVITRQALVPSPRPIRRAPLDGSAVGMSLRLVGYGETDPTTTSSSGRRYQVTVPLTTVDSWLSFDDATHGICHGDSGGPAYLTSATGDEEVAGVHIWVPSSGTCLGGGSETRVDQYLDFVDGWIAQVDPGSLPDMTAPFVDAASPARADASAPPKTDASTTAVDVGGGCSVAPRGGRAPLALVVIALVALTARGRRRRG